MAFKMFYRIGMPVEKEILSSIKDEYYGLCIGANIASFGKNWVSQYLKTIKKPFFIDPMTCVFRYDVDDISKGGEVKKSYSKLIKEYHLENKYHEGHIEFLEWDEKQITEFVDYVLAFQRDITKPEDGSQKSLLEYSEFLGDLPSDIELPDFLIAPYFHFENTSDEWYGFNCKLLKKAKNNSNDIPVYGMVCTEISTILDKSERQKIIDDFSYMDGVIIWISEFNEHRQNETTLKAYLNFIIEMAGNNINCITLYGSYFSLLASRFGLCGMSSGLGISESKKVNAQPTGGVFSNKYYIPEARTMAVEADARTLYVENPSILCNCNVCNGSEGLTIEEIHQFFDELTSTKAKVHYCFNRKNELYNIETASLNSILDHDIQFCEKNIDCGKNISYKHLYIWKKVLNLTF